METDPMKQELDRLREQSQKFDEAAERVLDAIDHARRMDEQLAEVRRDFAREVLDILGGVLSSPIPSQ
jgi:chemotaxis regulatin CheY-phosphate phosphatase CheZ